MAKIIGVTTATPMAVDQDYNPKSKNAQSGVAIAGAIGGIEKAKADKSTTLAGYNITDAYTKAETDQMLSEKADKSELPQKVSELENDSGYLVAKDIEGKVDASSVYTKDESDKITETLSSGLLAGDTSETVYEDSNRYLMKKENIEIDGVTYPYVYYFSILNTIKPKKTYRLNLVNANMDVDIDEIFCRKSLKIVCTDSILNRTFSSFGELSDYTVKDGMYLSARFCLPEIPDETNTFFMFTCDKDICPPNSPVSYNPISILLEVFTDYTKPYYKHEVYNKAEVDELTNPARVLIANGDTVYLENNKTYYAKEPINRLNVSYPNGDFIASLEFTVAKDNDGIISISLPQSKYIGGAPTLADGETWELNIKNGVVAGGLVE